MYRKSSMKEGVFTILSDLSGAYFSVQCHKLFSFKFSHRKAFNNIYVMKEYEKKQYIF